MRSLRWPHWVILIANLSFCVAGLFVADLPSWRMFERVPDPRYQLHDDAGRRYRVEDYLPRDAYSFRPETLVAVARFICERGATASPLTLSVDGRRYRVKRAGARCRSHERGGARR